MAKVTSFITGANAKVKVDGKTFAYASDVSYQVVVDTVPIETMGRYEAVTNEPVNYSVAGELSVVRYTSIAQARAKSAISNGAAGGNGLGNVTGTSATKLSDQIDPGNILFSATWDLDVFQKTQATEGAVTTTDTTSVIKISDCRFTRKSAGINKRGILVDRLSFVGILGQDDSFAASNSGDSDLS